VPVGQYVTCWQTTVVTACPDLLALSAFNMKADGLFGNSVPFCRSPWRHSQENNLGTRLLTSSYTIEAKICGSSTLYRHTDIVWRNKCLLKKLEESKDAVDFANFSSYRYLLSWQMFKASGPSLLQCAAELKSIGYK